MLLSFGWHQYKSRQFKAIFGIDTVSRRQYVLKIKDLNTGEVFDTH